MCISIASGNWSDPATWDCPASMIPTASDSVSIDAGHTVTLDVDAEVAMLEVLTGGDFDVANTVTGLSLSVNAGPANLNEASINLAGNLTVNAVDQDITLGVVGGPNSLVLNTSGQTILNRAVNVNQLITDDAAGNDTTIVADEIGAEKNNIRGTQGLLAFNDSVIIVDTVVLFAMDGQVIFNGGLNAGAASASEDVFVSAVSGSVHLSSVGSNMPFGNLLVEGGAGITVGGDIITIGEQFFIGSIVQNSDVVYSGFSGDFNGGIDASGNDVTFDYLSDFTVPGDAPLTDVRNLTLGLATDQNLNRGNFSTRIDNDISVSGSQLYNSFVVLENSAVLSGENLIFNKSVETMSCGPTLTLNTFNDGLTAFDPISNDGALLSVVINADGVTDIGGSLNFNSIVFNNPVNLTSDTSFIIIGPCNDNGLVFNSTIDGEFELEFTGSRKAPVIFNGAVGGNFPPDFIRTNTEGSVLINADVTSTGVISFFDPVVQGADVTYTGSQIEFIDTFDADSTANDRIAIFNSINNGGTDFLSPVGGSGAFESIVTNADGSTRIAANLSVNGALLAFNDLVRIEANVALIQNGLGGINFADGADIDSHNLTINTASSGLAMGRISGDGALIKTGDGTFTLLGINTYSGQTIINAGTLLIDGETSPLSPVFVNAGSLGGSGVAAGPVVVASASLSPGNSPGALCTADVLLESASTFIAEINGLTPGVEHDQLLVNGTVTLDGGNLNLTGNYLPEGLNDIIVLINNDGTESIAGIFAALPEGSFVNNNGPLRVTYTGGDGNDIALIDDEAVFADSFEVID